LFSRFPAIYEGMTRFGTFIALNAQATKV